jgi:multidrug resistance efflux pump
MLNISHNSIDRDRILKDQSSYQEVINTHITKSIIYVLTGLLIISLVVLFLPWTQNIRSRGKLTTLQPQDREQMINSMIDGIVEKWFVREGQLIESGDTIVFISEMKSEYLDPQLIDRAKNQSDAKRASVQAYQQKADALAQQVQALRKNQTLKFKQAKNYLQQTQLKVVSDSIEFQTALVNLDIAQKQVDRQEILYKEGLKSLTDLEMRRQKYQEAVNDKVYAENVWLASKNELLNAEINLNNITNEFAEKIAKAQSDRMSALSASLEAESQYQKLVNQLSNYSQRSGFYYITAPQNGFVTKALVTGIGATIKEGEPVFSFIPADYELAVEIYVRPLDLPLIREGNQVRLQFDGWPALVFQGWPNLSFGTFSGVIVAFDKAAGPDGNFRVLVAQDPNDEPWPELLRLGSGVYGIALLKNVPVWYELWRNLNGFPPDFYIDETEMAKPNGKKLVDGAK